MRVLLCGGGTAGHVNPALAIAETIEQNIPGSVIAYVVTEKGIENRLVDYQKYTINVKGLKKGVFSNVKVIYLALKSIKRAKYIINDFKPDIVIGTGGYSCFPVIYAAHKLGVKAVLHESNAYPGKAVRLLSRYADMIFLNYKESEKYFEGRKAIVCGTPYLKGFLRNSEIKVEKNGRIKTILCFGGSLGAEKINECAMMIAEEIIKKGENTELIWGCGKREYEKCRNLLISSGFYDEEKIHLRDYIDNMPTVLAKADIVVCRAGAMSVSEMAYNKKCTVFIPSPNVTDNHQYKNARALSDCNAAYLVEEKDINTVPNIINYLLDNDEKRMTLSQNISKFCVRNSNKIIFENIKELIK